MVRTASNLTRILAHLAWTGLATVLLALPALAASDLAWQDQPATTEQPIATDRARVYDEGNVNVYGEDNGARYEHSQASPAKTQTPEGQNLNTDDGTKLRIDVYTGNDYAK